MNLSFGSRLCRLSVDVIVRPDVACLDWMPMLPICMSRELT
jgi:hypothetical protein